MSLRASAGSPRSSSGAMHESVPATVLVRVAARRRATPTAPSDARRMTPCKPEVEHLGAPVGCDHDVRAFQIAMDDAVSMRVRQRVGNLHPVANDLFDREAAWRNDVREPLAFDVLHDDVRLTVEDADFVDGADVRMIQLRGMLRFALQSRLRVGIGAERDLDGDVRPSSRSCAT